MCHDKSGTRLSVTVAAARIDSSSRKCRGVRLTEPTTEHAHDGALLHHSQIGQQSQLQPSGHSEAAHSCDQRLGQFQAGWTLEEAHAQAIKNTLNCMTCIA